MIQYLDEVAKQVKEAKNKHGFMVSKLDFGTKIILHTVCSRYEIQLHTNQKAFISGGNRPDKSIRFPGPVEIIILGSSWGGSMIQTDWVGKSMHFEFIEQEKKLHHRTSNILGAALESPDGKQCFILDW